MTSNSIFPRKSDIFHKSILDARETIARPSLDTLYQTTFSFGNWQTWLAETDLIRIFSGSKRSQGLDFMKKMSLMCAEAEIPGTSFEKNSAIGHHQGIQEEFPNFRSYPPLNLTFYVDAEHVILQVLEGWMSYINPIATNKRQLNAYGRFNYPEDYKEIIHITKFERDTFLDEIPTADNVLREETANIPKGKNRVLAGIADFLTNDRFDFDKRGTLINKKSPNEFVPVPLRTPTTKLMSYEFVNCWPTNMTSMRVAYGDSNVLRLSVEFAYDRFFTNYHYVQTNQAVDDFSGSPVELNKNRTNIPDWEKNDDSGKNQWWDFLDLFPNPN